MFRTFVLIVVLLAVLVACGPGPKAITRAELRDTIFSIEPRLNGMTVVWFTHDDLGSYCTGDPEVAARAHEIFSDSEHAPEVIATYRTLNVGDKESDASILDWDYNGCPREGNSDTGMTTYLLLDIRRVGQ